MASDDPVFPAAPVPSAAAPIPVAPGTATPRYRKLPGRVAVLRVGRFNIQKLYLGEDHLLQTETVFFVENYKRFAYTDIRSLLVRRTPRGVLISVMLGLLVAGCGLLGWGMYDEATRRGWWVVAGFFGLLLVVNIARGETCHCQLETVIGPQPLLSLNRMRPTRRALALLAERIVAAQGEIPSNEAAERVDETLRKQGEQRLAMREPKPEAKTPEERW